MPKNCRSGHTIKTSSLKTIVLVIKFSQIANMLKLNKTKSSKQSFLDLFELWTQ